MIIKPSTCIGCVLYEPPYGKKTGFSYPDGTGLSGVMVIAEALGELEEKAGKALVGKAGHYLFTQLQRVGIERDNLTLFNVIACRPPDNKLASMPYEQEAIKHCSPNLDKAIEDARTIAQSNGKTFTIITLGNIAFKRVLGIDQKDPILREEFYCYPFWSDKYQAWVLAAPHPSYLMRGKHELVPVLCFVFKRALEIAEDGLKLDEPYYMLDPDPSTFDQWVRDYEHAWLSNPDGTFLSYDIETPGKQGKGEDELGKEEGDDYVILRCSFAYKPGQAVSVPWGAEYRASIEELFSSQGTKVGWNSQIYDDPRIMAQMPIHGDRLDSMQCWHVLNSALPKALGFVTPFYVNNTSLWKHLSHDRPAFYNSKDADMALRCFLGIKMDLEKNGLWPVYERHVIKVHQVFNYMSEKGVLLDQELRVEAEKKLSDLLDVTELKMEANIPQEARKLKVFKKPPKDIEGMVQVDGETLLPQCPVCGFIPAKADHFKSIGKKRLKVGEVENYCIGRKAEKVKVPTKLWAKPLEFKVSKLGLSNYQKALKHQAIISRKEKKVTFDEKAILQLIKKYPNDPLYPLILEHREVSKLLSTYVGVTQLDGSIRGGMPVGFDGRVHTLFTSNPSTLRSASQDPNLQNLPRSKGEHDLATIIRNLIIAGPGNILTARDFSGIEAVLTGYFACAPRYIRLSKIDVHSYYTAYALNQLDGRVASSDLPDISWPDEKLIPHLAWIKKTFKKDRNELYKHLVHAINFGQGAKGAQEKILNETGITFPVALIKKVMDLYKELFPEIPKWQWSLLLQAEKDGFLRNPFGYVHRFSKPLDYEKVGGKWQKSQGPDANRVWAFLPQSSAAGIIKEAMLRLYFKRFEEAGQYLRLLVHDELFSECPIELVDIVDGVMQEEMERPIECMPLPRSYGMGSHLVILTEAKKGYRWGSMK